MVGPEDPDVVMWGSHAHSSKIQNMYSVDLLTVKERNLFWKVYSLEQGRQHVKRFSAVGLHFLAREK